MRPEAVCDVCQRFSFVEKCGRVRSGEDHGNLEVLIGTEMVQKACVLCCAAWDEGLIKWSGADLSKVYMVFVIHISESVVSQSTLELELELKLNR